MLVKEKNILCLFLFVPFYIFSSSFNDLENKVRVPSESKLKDDFKKEGFGDFIKKTKLLESVAGKTITDTKLITIGIEAQLSYQVKQDGFDVIQIFNKKNQNKIYSILFQNNLDLLKKLQEQGVL